MEVRGFGVVEVRGFGFGVLEVRGFLFGFSMFQVSRLRGSGFRVRGFSRFLGSTFQGCRFVFLRFGVSGSGFRDSGFWRFGVFEVRGLVFVVSGSGFRVRGFRGTGFRGLWFRVPGFEIQGWGCWVSWFGVGVSGFGSRFSG